MRRLLNVSFSSIAVHIISLKVLASLAASWRFEVTLNLSTRYLPVHLLDILYCANLQDADLIDLWSSVRRSIVNFDNLDWLVNIPCLVPYDCLTIAYAIALVNMKLASSKIWTLMTFNFSGSKSALLEISGLAGRSCSHFWHYLLIHSCNSASHDTLDAHVSL